MANETLVLPSVWTPSSGSAELPSPDEIRARKLEVVGRLLQKPIPFVDGAPSALLPPHLGVLGMGFGRKLVGGRASNQMAVRVYVRAKKPRSQLGPTEVITSRADLVTDVIAIEPPVPFSSRPPLLGGDIAAVRGVNRGTTGCLVKVNGADGYLLSCNHVLAQCNQPGLKIVVPSKCYQAVGDLEGFVPLEFASTKTNHVDVAWVRLESRKDWSQEVDQIGPVAGPAATPKLGALVAAHGQSTGGRSEGRVVDASFDGKIPHVPHGNAQFDDLFVVEGNSGAAFARPGDSGALVVDWPIDPSSGCAQPMGVVIGGFLPHAGNPVTQVLVCKFKHIEAYGVEMA